MENALCAQKAMAEYVDLGKLTSITELFLSIHLREVTLSPIAHTKHCSVYYEDKAGNNAGAAATVEGWKREADW